MDTKSFEIAKKYLGKIVEVIVDRPIGSLHPEHNFKYLVNYGFIEGVMAQDGEELDAYVLKEDKPLKKFSGKVVGIIHRTNDNDDKLVVIPEDQTIGDEEIEKLTEFQEKWYKHEIVK